MAKLLLFTAALLLCAVSAMSANRCPDCGTTPVPYPLSTGADCGDQEYKIRFDEGKLIFDSVNSSYSIAFISPETQRLVIRPASFAGDTCITTDFPKQGIQLNNSLPFNVTSSNTIMFLNCTESLFRSPLNCSSISLCHTYINGTQDAAACVDAPICCTFKAGGSTTAYSIRVRESGCSAYRSFVNLDPNAPLDRWPEPGVELQWVSPREPVCRSQADCTEGMNSTCGPDPATTGVSRCFCKSGLSWDSIAGLCA